jgi:hypothetical protein
MRHTIANEAAMRTTAAAFVLLLSLPALAAEEPDAVYARYHRAVVAGDLEEVVRNGTARTRSEITGLPVAQREAVVKALGASMPRAFSLLYKNVAPDGQSARLLLRGPGGSVLDARPETLWGNVRMVLERGEWKVAAAEWSTEPPQSMRSAATTPAPPSAPGAPKAAGQKPAASAPAAAQKAVPAARGAALVGSVNATPERKLGMQKEPCVYKPVMTAEDLENCK